MATVIWKGGAPAVAQVQTYTFAGTWEATDLVRCTIGLKTVDFVAGSTVIATAIAAVVAAWNLLSATTYPEFAEITASIDGTNTKLVLTCDTAGVPFICTITPLETGGGAADDQRIEGDVVATTGTAATANSGPNCWDTAANYDTGAVPVATNDLILDRGTWDILYGFPALSSLTLNSLTKKRSFTGRLGLPEDNAGGYPEYRSTYATVSATTINLEQGEGNGSDRIKINTGTIQTALNVYYSDTRAETGIPAILWKGTHAANTVTVNRGDLGIAFFGGETAVVATLTLGYVTNQASDSYVKCGDLVTLTTINKIGGELEISSNVATVKQEGAGSITIGGTATATSLTVEEGTCYYESSGTATTIIVGNSGTLDYRRDSRARTVTNMSVYNGGRIYDPGQTVTLSNGVDYIHCKPSSDVDFGAHRTWTPTAI